MIIKKNKKIILTTIITITLFIGNSSLTTAYTPVASFENDIMSTNDWTELTDTSAKLNGSIFPGADFPAGQAANVYFRYSPLTDFPPVFCNDIYGSSMRSTKDIKVTPSTGNSVSFSSIISNLEPDTTYYYCAIGSNKKHIAYGEVKFFTSLPDQTISVTTKDPLVTNGTSVYLNGFYNTALPAETWFEYKKVTTSNQNASARSISGIQSFTAVDVSSVKNAQDFSASSKKSTSTSGKAIISSEDSWSNKINSTTRKQNTSGGISYLLKGLSPNSTYSYHVVIKSNTGSSILYGGDITFNTLNSSSSGEESINNYNSTNSNDTNNNNNQNTGPLVLGQTATPPDDAIVHYHEGIETVLARQIIKNTDIAESYGYLEGQNLQNFAWTLAHNLAKTFGYVSSSGKEIRVSPVDRAAYELRMEDGNIAVYEYLDSKIVNIQKTTWALRLKYVYEYYFSKK